MFVQISRTSGCSVNDHIGVVMDIPIHYLTCPYLPRIPAAIEVNNTLTDIRQKTKCACDNIALCANDTGHGYRVAVAVMSFIPTTRS